MRGLNRLLFTEFDVLASTTSGTATNATGPEVDVSGAYIPAGVFRLDISAATGVSPTLDAIVQTTYDGTNWVDVARFSQVSGTGAARRFQPWNAKFYPAGLSTASMTLTPTDGTMTAGTSHSIPLGKKVRLKYTVGGTTPSFTFAVRFFPIAT